jgi:hypothetical protein
MCLAPKMPEVKVPQPAATAAPAAPPPDLLTAYENKDKPSNQANKKRSGKKALRYNPTSTANVAGKSAGTGLQIKK